MLQIDLLFIELFGALCASRFDKQQWVACEQIVTGAGGQGADDAAALGLDLELHFHRFHHRQLLTGADLLARLDRQTDQHALDRRLQRLAAGRGGGFGWASAVCLGADIGMQLGMRLISTANQRGGIVLDKTGGDLVALYVGMLQQILQKGPIAAHALQAELAQCPIGAAQHAGIVSRALHDQLGQQRVERRVGGVAAVTVAIDAHAMATGRLVGSQGAAAGGGAAVGLHGFQVDAQLHSEAPWGRYARLFQIQFGEAGAGRQTDLQLRQIQPGHRFGDGVLDLDARVGLHEYEIAIVLVHQELDGTQAAIAYGGGQGHGGSQQAFAQQRVESRCGSHFQQFLVAPLQGAIALPQMADRATIADDLHLDMPGAADQPFDIQIAIAEGGACLGAAAGEGLLQFIAGVHGAHTAPATAGQGLEHDCRACRQPGHEGLRLLQTGRLVGSLDQRHIMLDRQAPGAGLITEQFQYLGIRADKGDAGLGASAGEDGILAEKAVARVDGIAVMVAGDIDQLPMIQISRGAAAAQCYRGIGLA